MTDKKKKYLLPVAEIIEFSDLDIITVSFVEGEDEDGENWGNLY